VSDHYQALARTTLLLNQEYFSSEADERRIADTLLGTTVRFEADEESLSSRAGQTAFITGFILTARLGIGVEIAAPNVPLIDLVAPLRLPALVDALLELGRDLIPGAHVGTTSRDSDETFVFGNPSVDAVAPIQVTADDFTAGLLRRDPEGDLCAGDLPFGGFAAGAAIAALALDAALPRIEAATRLTARRPRPSSGPPVQLDIREMLPELADGISLDLEDVDVISGGAITHALLFCLLRIPALTVRARVIEQQRADLSNVNRYALLRASDDGRLKTEQLESAATPNMGIVGVPALFTKQTKGSLLPLAERVLVGVDDVEARWWIQEEDPGWLAVGATGNHLAQLTTHVPGGPCAACAHPIPLPPQIIPTISFVSFWAGLLQACALISERPCASTNTVVYPFALGGGAASARFSLVPNPACPIRCLASGD
jgi:hypothetical protein